MSSVVIHGHFYQPPREDPFLDEVEAEPSAAPFHDWNQRIERECYRAVVAARITTSDRRIERLVNTLDSISFNVGPTLLEWMERDARPTYDAIIAADQESARRLGGHGNAIAQPYHHTILPLATRRDKRTEVRWGIADFRRRFEREPEGMWLPETAVDTPTLEVLADQGVAFTVLAPHQAAAVRLIDAELWTDVSGARIDPRRPYLARLPSGRTITLFFYDGPVSQAVAFEHLLESGDRFADRLLGAFDSSYSGTQLVHIATDGETYGHHHRHGDMALAYALHRIEADPSVTLTNYGEHLERAGPREEVRIVERTSWSCAHGIERWRSDCGCNSGGRPQWHQRWRAPLRIALDWLSNHLAGLFEERAATYLKSPWQAREDYVDVIHDRSTENLQRFWRKHGRGKLKLEQRSDALKLLELQRHAMLMYTSCGWFFDDISGIETTQILRYAARAIQLASELSDVAVEGPFLERLADAPSNIPDAGDGRAIYEKFVSPIRVDLHKLVAHYAVSSLFTEYHEKTRVYAYCVERIDYRSSTLGRSKLAVGRVRVTSEITAESALLSFGIVHLGDHNMSGGVRGFKGEVDYTLMCEEAMGAFFRADMPEVLRLLDKHFGELTYSMRSLFRDEQRRVLDIIVGSALKDAETLSSQLYERHSPLLRYLATLDQPLDVPLRGLADFVLNTTLRKELRRTELDHKRIRILLREAEEVGTRLDRVGMSFELQQVLEHATDEWSSTPDRLGRLRRLRQAVELANALPFELDLSQVQNGFYALMRSCYPHFSDHAAHGDSVAQEWSEHFRALGEALRIRVSLPSTGRGTPPGCSKG
jgi:alpha-amylase/alpha-mannosidase (GH57 family)